MKIETIDIERVIPYARNPRKNAGAVDKVAASLREFGFRQPIVVDENYTVIVGHTRLLAAKKLGMTEVPVHIAEGLTDAQIKAYRIADNRTNEEAEWDIDLLKVEFKDLQDQGCDLSMTAFSEDELKKFFAEAAEGLTDPDSTPEFTENAKSKLGDIWVCGQHRIMCGSSLELTAMEQLCDQQRIDMLLTDPPYNVAYEGGTKEKLTIKNDSMSDEAFRVFLRDAFVTADAVMKPGAVFYIWHADKEGLNFRLALKDAGWKDRQLLIWEKSSLVLGRWDYQSKHEPCLYGWKEGAAHLWAADRKQTTILKFDKPSRNGEHPTMKPVALFEYQLLNNTKGGDIVLDSFGGSGTTLIAAEKNGRIARIMELDPKYVDVIVKRWQDFTGKEAVLESSGKKFNEIN